MEIGLYLVLQKYNNLKILFKIQAFTVIWGIKTGI